MKTRFIYLVLLSLIFTPSCYAAKHITLIAAPEVLAIPIQDNHEAMIDLRKKHDIAFGSSPEIPNNKDYTKMRLTVYNKLKQAQTLLPKGLRFCIYEAYRSPHTQKKIFNNRYAQVKKLHPHWSRTQIFNETMKLVSPVINLDGTKNVPPHTTGAAIDVYLIDKKGGAIPMSIHPKDWMADNDGSISQTDSKKITLESQRNRKIMGRALASVGFVNYPTEYWHWSYGDRYWAYIKGKSSAIYGMVGRQ